MQDLFLQLYVKAKTILETLKDESGQDLIEYALVVALIALGATVGMGTVATGINSAFATLANRLGNAINAG
jgi:pilus assembly protein Flp/PilA